MRAFLLSIFLFSSLHLAAQDTTAFKRVDSIVVSKQKQLLSKSDSASHSLDSVKGKVNQLSKKANSKLNPSLPDSLNPNKKILKATNDLQRKVNSMTHVDSLFAFNRELRKVDSLKVAVQAKANELKTKAGRKQKKVKHSLDSLQKEYDSRSKALTKKFTEKNKDLLAGHEKELEGKLNLNTPAISKQFPGLNLNSNLPIGTQVMPSIGNLNRPGTTLPNATLPNPSVPGASLPGNQANIPGLNNDPLKEVQQSSQELKKLEGQAGEYAKEAKQLKKDGLKDSTQLKKWTEDQIQGRTEIKALKDKENELKKQQELRKKYLEQVAKYRSPEKMEKEIKQQAANVANDVMAKNSRAVQKAQSEMSKAKKKYGEFQSMKNLPKRALNPMKELPFRERFYPGMLMQVQSSKFYSIDFAPQAYYKITTRFDVGTGFVYRLNADFNKMSFIQNHDLYGFKIFSNFKIYKSFYFRLEGERINRQVPAGIGTDLTNLRWTNTLLGGIGKEFTISKKIQGNTLVLYNALDHFDSPYPNKLVLRFGFNLSLKKDQRKEFIRSLQ